MEFDLMVTIPEVGFAVNTPSPIRLNESIRRWLETLDPKARAAVERGMAEA